MAWDFGLLHILLEYGDPVHNHCCRFPVLVVLEYLLVRIRLHPDRDFPAAGFLLTILLFPFHHHSLVWPAHVSAADFELDVSASFPE